jgi:hypothetical protein
MNTTIADDDDEPDDPRALAARLRGDERKESDLDLIDPDTENPRELARMILAARGRGR